jgi:hypothetical protein
MISVDSDAKGGASGIAGTPRALLKISLCKCSDCTIGSAFAKSDLMTSVKSCDGPPRGRAPIARSPEVDFGERHFHLRFELADDLGRRFPGQQIDHICPSMA